MLTRRVGEVGIELPATTIWRILMRYGVARRASTGCVHVRGSRSRWTGAWAPGEGTEGTEGTW